VELGSIGVWWSGPWTTPAEPGADVSAELEQLGFGALWSTGGFRPGIPGRFRRLLEATVRIPVVTGITNVWLTPADELAPAAVALQQEHPGRFLLGLGASHHRVVEGYARPWSKVSGYLDDLDALAPTVPVGQRLLAALGPRMLALAGERSLGAHPYFVPVEHTAFARSVLGEGPLLAPEVTVVLERDPSDARRLARQFTAGYLSLPNFAGNLVRLGFSADDVAGAGSDRLIDAVVAWGSPDQIAERVHQHLAAGADHVCLQVVSDAEGMPIRAYRVLAPALGLPGA
jgi:probable F420-dependent oxidoreductase